MSCLCLDTKRWPYIWAWQANLDTFQDPHSFRPTKSKSHACPGSCGIGQKWRHQPGTLQNLGRDDLEVFSTIKDPCGLETKSCSKSSRPIFANVAERRTDVLGASRGWIWSVSQRLLQGYIAQWLERLTADQQVPGSNPSVPFPICFRWDYRSAERLCKQCACRESSLKHKHGRLVCCRYTTGALTACGPETVPAFRLASQGPPLLDRHRCEAPRAPVITSSALSARATGVASKLQPRNEPAMRHLRDSNPCGQSPMDF